jgi:hypothetical protein
MRCRKNSTGRFATIRGGKKREEDKWERRKSNEKEAIEKDSNRHAAKRCVCVIRGTVFTVEGE